MNDTQHNPKESDHHIENHVHLDNPSEEKSGSNATNIVLASVAALLVGVLVTLSLYKGNTPSTDKDLYGKQAELEAAKNAVNAERIKQGLPPLEGVGADSPAHVAARLTKDASVLASYADSYNSMIAEKNSIIADKNSSLIASEEARKALSSQLARASNAEASLAEKDAIIKRLEQQLAEAKQALLSNQEKMNAYMNRPSSDELLAAKTRIAELEAQLAALRTPAPTTKLFAESEADLYPAGQALFRALRELEDKSDIEIASSYNRFASEYNATYVKDIRFATGSSELNPADKLALGDALANVPNDAFLLVVGYASTTGNADTNRQLSSDRATTVAQSLNMAKTGNQQVQAVFLGQTKRFSTRIPERNQVCEIWQIRAKAAQ